jgi:hypothetical protein
MLVVPRDRQARSVLVASVVAYGLARIPGEHAARGDTKRRATARSDTDNRSSAFRTADDSVAGWRLVMPIRRTANRVGALLD